MIDGDKLSNWLDNQVSKGLMSATECPIYECEIDYKNERLIIVDDTQKGIVYDFINK